MRDMRMSVCREIQWRDVKINHQGRTLSLPLTEKFLLQTHFLAEGTIPESNAGYWQLPMELDQSFQRLFGYEYNAGQLRPIEPTEITSPQFMEPPLFASSGHARGRANQATPLRILVVMGLGCVKERNDFEPGGVLGAARLIPHFMLVANQPVESMEATVQLEREALTAHTRMDNEEMSPKLSAALFTDRNGNLTPNPTWDNLFDYYWIDPLLRTEMNVVRRDRPFARERAGLVNEAFAKPASRGTANFAYRPRTVRKVPRQGEFDNIHLAPRMKLPASVVAKLPKSSPSEVTMAPFCIHDCLHLHWRWGEPGNGLKPPKWVRGWSKIAPYREPGAPMVPHNQDITLTLMEDCKVAYTARVSSPEASRWQVIMHHGAAYAISKTILADLTPKLFDALTTNLQAETAKEGPWTHFYWHLRYALLPHPLRAVDPTDTLSRWLEVKDSHMERLSWSPGGFREARDL